MQVGDGFCIRPEHSVTEMNAYSNHSTLLFISLYCADSEPHFDSHPGACHGQNCLSPHQKVWPQLHVRD